MSLSLDAVPDGGRILIDTDVWLYLFTGNSPECVRLGARCNEGAIQAYITTIVVGEFCHRAGSPAEGYSFEQQSCEFPCEAEFPRSLPW